MKAISKKQINIHKRQNNDSDSRFLPKSLEDLNLMDAFLMEATTENVENAKKIAKVVIERATGHTVENLIVETEKQLKGLSLDRRGIRMDIYVQEQNHRGNGAPTLRLYDIEPNKYYEKDIPRRSRFYQSLIDSKLLPTDTPFEDLPDVITIWILPYDPFGENRMIYTVKNMVVENNELMYNDGVIKLFLYTKGTKGGSQKLKDLLTYIEHTTPSNAVDDDLLKIQEIVDNVKNRKDVGKRYMTLQEMINYEKSDSRIEGAIRICKSLNFDITQTKKSIMQEFKLTESFADDYISLYWESDNSK